MSKTITLTDEAALIAQCAVHKAREKWPVLSTISDSEVLAIIMRAGLLDEEACI